MTEEKDGVLGLEPVTEFLPSARFKSGNNLVLRDRRTTRLMIPGYLHHSFTDLRRLFNANILLGYRRQQGIR
jgi:hypothetical protein